MLAPQLLCALEGIQSKQVGAYAGLPHEDCTASETSRRTGSGLQHCPSDAEVSENKIGGSGSPQSTEFGLRQQLCPRGLLARLPVDRYELNNSLMGSPP
ncbi:hypothetical protein EOD39_2706 [Acipenser ruthenus]|uniref:Uncharacterized protein n=1 Tax=Acipenser ruthenus TaxID=7906 RepID=A0A444TYX2_ACIRT|nr:hypothetical protein EOD39_2706 [Acipenser ruthenus]